MSDVKVRRPYRHKRLVSIVSLGDIALADDPRQNAAATLCGVDGEHSQGSGRVHAGVIFPRVLRGDGSFPPGPGLSPRLNLDL